MRYASNVLSQSDYGWYELHGLNLTLKFDTNTYQIGDGSIFFLGCGGVTRAQGSIMPLIALMSGAVQVQSTHTYLGMVAAPEALIGPAVANPVMAYSVTRKPSNTNPSYADKANFAKAPLSGPPGATVTASSMNAGKLVNVTPYITAENGQCQHVISARLTSTPDWQGTASYKFPQALKKMTSAVPVVVGADRVGSRLTVQRGKWGPAPIRFTYRWLASGKPIGGATGSSITLTRSQRGKRIAVQVTGSKAGYQAVSRSSLPTRPVS